ncbi:chemotaxis protein CheB [Cryptosporangium aurantiacum]|uniref:chemotaxis protein CheB n=1 Tax=Cryptosporangium aurantiacum TaxID=134849 RepID=UPI0011615246
MSGRAEGVEGHRSVVRRFPTDLPAALLVVLHTSPGGSSVLGSILDRVGPLPARTATDAMRPAPAQPRHRNRCRSTRSTGGVGRWRSGPHRPN